MSDEAATTEILRLQCLQALGITVYHPRFRLPGAKPSVLGPLAEITTAARAESQPADVVSQQRVDSTARGAEPARAEPRTESLSQTLVSPGSTFSSPSASAAATDAARTAAPRTADERAPTAPRADVGAQVAVQNFQLLFLQVDEDLAIINQIPALARPQLQDKHTALLTNLLRWLGKPMPAQAPRMFRWPLPGLEHMASSMSAATSLQHFLEQASSERGFRFLLALGPQAIASASPGWQTFATHSVDEMLALPALKREVWQALLPLHALLSPQSLLPADSQTQTRR